MIYKTNIGACIKIFWNMLKNEYLSSFKENLN